MEYKIVMKSAASIMPNWAHAAAELTAEVNAAIRQGWEPLGGLATCHVGSVLMQAMTREYIVAEEVEAQSVKG